MVPLLGYDYTPAGASAVPTIGGCRARRSRVAGRRDEGLELALEMSGERQARQVAVLRPDDLDADREPAAGEPARRRGRRQVERAAVAGPEQMVGDGEPRAVDDQGALVALALVVVGKGGAPGDGAEQQIVLGEELGPRAPHAVARLVRGEPVAVRQDRRARRARVVALVTHRQPARDRRVLLEVRIALAVRRGGAQEARVEGEGFARVDGRARAVVDLCLLPAQEVAERLEPV